MAKKTKIIILVIIFLIVLLANILSQKKYIVTEGNTDMKQIGKEEKKKIYIDKLEKIEIKENGKIKNLEDLLSKKENIIEQMIKESIKKEEQINGTLYQFSNFSIFVCNRIYEDHVSPNQDIIITTKDFELDLTKHCISK